MAAQETQASHAERRHAVRTRRLLKARCVFNNGCSDLSVLVRNMSAIGAKLKGDELLCLPEEFELQIADGSGAFASRRVRRTWLRDDAMGVAFIDDPCEAGKSSPRGAIAGRRVAPA
jgi:hypothetical protein